MMSLSVSSFPEAHSKLTTNPTWGEGHSPTTKRWYFGDRLNKSGASFMKGIRHIGKVQLKSSVARLAPKSPSQSLPPTPPPTLSVRAPAIVIDINAVSHDGGRQSSKDASHDASIPGPTDWSTAQAPAPVDSTFLPISEVTGYDFTAFAMTQRPLCPFESRHIPEKVADFEQRSFQRRSPVSPASRPSTPSSCGPPGHSPLVLAFPMPTPFESPIASPSALTRWRAVPLLVKNPRPRAASAGAGGAASGTVQQPRTRVNSEAASAARGGSTSPVSSRHLRTREMSPVPDLPVVILTPADRSDPDGSPPTVTHERKNELLSGDSNLRRRETGTTVRKRSLSTSSGKHVRSRIRQLPPPPPLPPLPPPPPSPLPLLGGDIARLRSGSRPAAAPLSPYLVTGRRPNTAPADRATTLPLSPRGPTGPRSMRDGHGSPTNLSRSLSQPQLRTTATAIAGATRSAASAAGEQPISSRTRTDRPAPALAPAGHVPPQEGGSAHEERRPRTAPETGYTARPLPPVVRGTPRRSRSYGTSFRLH